MSAVLDVRITARIGAPADKIFSALTSARELTRWWLVGAETNARGAGRVRLVWPKPRTGGAGAAVIRTGVFMDLQPARKVAWYFQKPKQPGVPELVSVFIEPRRAHCDVTWLQSGFSSDAEAVRGEYARLWEDALAKLRLYLETGRTCKLENLDLQSAEILARGGKK